jgi:hypothetical protein
MDVEYPERLSRGLLLVKEPEVAPPPEQQRAVGR